MTMMLITMMMLMMIMMTMMDDADDDDDDDDDATFWDGLAWHKDCHNGYGCHLLPPGGHIGRQEEWGFSRGYGRPHAPWGRFGFKSEADILSCAGGRLPAKLQIRIRNIEISDSDSNPKRKSCLALVDAGRPNCKSESEYKRFLNRIQVRSGSPDLDSERT